MSGRRGGARSKYTPDRVAVILDALRLGATIRLACQAAGITPETFYDWRNRKREFSDAIEKTEAQRALHWLGKIEAAAEDGTWTAAAWKLERIYPAEYGRRTVEVSGPGGTPIQVERIVVRPQEAPSS